MCIIVCIHTYAKKLEDSALMAICQLACALNGTNKVHDNPKKHDKLDIVAILPLNYNTPFTNATNSEIYLVVSNIVTYLNRM